MFCPTCGKDNSLELKFCASCGTNLEAVSQALTGVEEDFFSKMDSGMDYFIARYAEHVFKDAPHGLADRSVKKSWVLLGQAVVTTLVDILLFTLMWNVLPLRFLILTISTPFRLLARRNRETQHQTLAPVYQAPKLPDGRPSLWLDNSTMSVTENTTKHLEAVSMTESKKTIITDKLGND
jgi:hypothetical protein